MQYMLLKQYTISQQVARDLVLLITGVAKVIQCKKLFLDISKCLNANLLLHHQIFTILSTWQCSLLFSMHVNLGDQNLKFPYKNGSIALLHCQDMIRHGVGALIHVECPFQACMKAIVQETQNRDFQQILPLWLQNTYIWSQTVCRSYFTSYKHQKFSGGSQ